MKGRITRSYTVWCALCENWRHADGSSVRSSGQDVKRWGWKLTKKHGWVCPSCHKSLTAAKETK